MATTTAEPTSTITTDVPASDLADLSPEARLQHAEKIVKRDMYWSMGVGSVPVPIIDLLGVGGFQLRMIKDLSHLYGVKFSEHAARNIISALVGSVGARVLTVATVGSVIKSLPGVGAFISGVLAMPLISGAATYALGRVFVQHFESGGTFLDFSTEKVKERFATHFQEGKKVVTQSKRTT
jgi:uncharacterized protein (DUF697 family)